MFDGFVGSDTFYLLFGLSYLTLVGVIISYLRDLKRLSQKVDVENKRLEMMIHGVHERDMKNWRHLEQFHAELRDLQRKNCKTLAEDMPGVIKKRKYTKRK